MITHPLLQKYKTILFSRFKNPIINIFGKAEAGTFLHDAVMKFSKTTTGAIPYVIKLDITKKCPLGCEMCYAGHENAEMEFDQARKFLSEFKNVPIRLDLLGGEPLMHRDVFKIASYAKKKVRVGEVVLYTNGTLMTEKAVSQTKDSLIDRVIVNLNSHDPEKHDSFTGVKGSWEKTTAGIKLLREHGVKTYAFIVVHAKNIIDCEKTKDFVEATLKVKPLFYHYIPMNGLDPLTPSPADWDSLKKRILDENRPHAETIGRINTFCGKCCLGGYYSFSVKVNGDVTPCPFISDLVIGNVFRKSFWEIFSERRSSESFNNFMTLPAECAGCSYDKVCGGGCRAGIKDAAGNYTKRDFRCMGPWDDRINPRELFQKMPMFF